MFLWFSIVVAKIIYNDLLGGVPDNLDGRILKFAQRAIVWNI